jgi:hypothetical protein
LAVTIMNKPADVLKEMNTLRRSTISARMESAISSGVAAGGDAGRLAAVRSPAGLNIGGGAGGAYCGGRLNAVTALGMSH